MWGHGNSRSRIQYGRRIQIGRLTQVIPPRWLCTLNGKHGNWHNWWVHGKQPTHSNVSTRIQYGRQIQYDLDLHKIYFALKKKFIEYNLHRT